ncbi:MAG: polysaccharide deacetylase family protein [Clostridia bacterium]|nr:polysaccharide deacetylase family protein [Clostridia bacterium]
MNQILYQGRKINKKKVVGAVVISVTALIILLVFLINGINDSIKIEEAEKQKKIELELKRKEEAEQEARRIEEEKRKAEILAKLYNPISEKEFVKLDNIYSHSDTKRVLLTFDDGPTEAVTPFILDFLKEQNIKANFFALGTMVERYPSLVKREYEEGHFIANHSYSHKYSQIYESVETVIDEYNADNQLIRDAVGNQNFNTLIFRFPGGSYGGYYADLKAEAKQKLRENGIASIDWNALTNDADGADTKEKIMENLVETTQDKSSIVLLMHDASDKILTYETLPDVINYFRENGYQFQTFFDVMGREY